MKKIKILLLIMFIGSVSVLTYLYMSNNGNVDKIFDNDEAIPLIPETLGNVNNDTITNYSDITELLNKSEIEIPIYENLIPQGITIVGDYIFIAVYDNFGLKNSKVYVMDFNGNIINITTIDSNSHVGGIAYDKKNDLIWLPDNNGVLNAFNRKDFMSKSHVFPKYQFDDLSEELLNYSDSSKHVISYLTITDNYIYIGSFALNNNGIIKKYKINNVNKEIDLEYISMFEVRDKIQGITFYDKYMILSSSYGRNNPSHLYIYKYDEELDSYIDKEIISYELPAMIEQITIYKDELYLIFENTAKKYWDSIDKIGHICVLDAKKTVNFELE